MEISDAYAIAVGGGFVLLFLVNSLPYVTGLAEYLTTQMSKHLTYPYLLSRHRFLGPWTRAGFGLQLIYIITNIVCLSVETISPSLRIASLSDVGLRAGTLSIINMIPLFAGSHLSYLADLLGLTLRGFRCIHRSAGLMSFSLAILHVLVEFASRPSFDMNLAENLFAVIGASSVLVIVVLSQPLSRKPSYEIFLRVHQALAGLIAYALWRHLPSDQILPRGFLYLSAGLFLSTLVMQSSILLYRNGIFRHHFPRAHITHTSGAVMMSIYLQKPIKIEAGQYINVWLPSVSFWSFMQSHPFVVVSKAGGCQDKLDLLIEPRHGLTQRLLYHAREYPALNRLAMFSGPHGASVPMDEYEIILMVASGFGIAALGPYLKQLIHNSHIRKVQARRVHVIWQIQDINIGLVGQPLLNGNLHEDKLDDDCILAISIYCGSIIIPKMPFGRRATLYSGTAPLLEIFQAEVTGELIERTQVEVISESVKSNEGKLECEFESELESGRGLSRSRDGKMLVTVSASDDIRDELRNLVRDHLSNGVSLVELDYQPPN